MVKTSGRIQLVVFATTEFRSQQNRLVKAALERGAVDKSTVWSFENLRDTDFFCRNEVIFTHKRGAGYWLWKPFIISEALKSSDADWVLYYDAGRGKGHQIQQRPEGLIAWCEENNQAFMPGVLIPQWGPTSWWTKRDAFVLLNCDEPTFHDAPQVQATFSLWRNDRRSLDFVRSWLDACEDPRLLTDQPNTCGLQNLPGFIDHRHDQSILTLLCLKSGTAALGAKNNRFEKPKSIDRVQLQLANKDLLAKGQKLKRKIVKSIRTSRLFGDVIRKRFPLDAIREYRMTHLD